MNDSEWLTQIDWFGMTDLERLTKKKKKKKKKILRMTDLEKKEKDNKWQSENDLNLKKITKNDWLGMTD